MLEGWIASKHRQGNKAAVKEGESLLEKFGDEPLRPSEQTGGIVRLPDKARELLTPKEGFWICTVEPKPLGLVVSENKPFFGYVTDSRTLLDLPIPVAFEVAFPVDSKGKARPIQGSNNTPLDEQDAMIGEFGQNLGIDGVRAVMQHASVVSQADIKHQKEIEEKFIVGFFARTPDQTFRSHVAYVGRFHDAHLLDVPYWYRAHGSQGVWALPAVVPADLEI